MTVVPSRPFAWQVGARCLLRYRTPPRRDTTLLHDALVCIAVQRAEAHELPALVAELRSIVERERRERRSIALAGLCMPPGSTAETASGAAAREFEHAWDDGSDDSSYFFSWRCRVCCHLSYFSVVRCSCNSDSYLCLKHALHTHTQRSEDGAKPVSYIHHDEDPGAVRRPATSKATASSSAAGDSAGKPSSAAVSAPADPPPTDVRHERDARSGVASAPPDPVHPSSSSTIAPPAGVTSAPPPADAAASAPPPSEAAASASLPAEDDTGSHVVAVRDVGAPEWVRFACTGCERRLKAIAPSGTQRMSVKCIGCAVQLQVHVSVEDDEQEPQQAGRARHMAGGPSQDSHSSNEAVDASSSCEGHRCKCAPGQRWLLVRHPLRQMQRLVDESSARLARSKPKPADK